MATETHHLLLNRLFSITIPWGTPGKRRKTLKWRFPKGIFSSICKSPFSGLSLSFTWFVSLIPWYPLLLRIFSHRQRGRRCALVNDLSAPCVATGLVTRSLCGYRYRPPNRGAGPRACCIRFRWRRGCKPLASQRRRWGEGRMVKAAGAVTMDRLTQVFWGYFFMHLIDQLLQLLHLHFQHFSLHFQFSRLSSSRVQAAPFGCRRGDALLGHSSDWVWKNFRAKHAKDA